MFPLIRTVLDRDFTYRGGHYTPYSVQSLIGIVIRGYCDPYEGLVVEFGSIPSYVVDWRSHSLSTWPGVDFGNREGESSSTWKSVQISKGNKHQTSTKTSSDPTLQVCWPERLYDFSRPKESFPFVPASFGLRGLVAHGNSGAAPNHRITLTYPDKAKPTLCKKGQVCKSHVTFTSGTYDRPAGVRHEQ